MITTITLGSGRFNISDKGYERLKLHMRNLTGSLPESMRGVVEEDAENRLCEYFSSKVSPANIITHLDVDAAFADLGLGSVSDSDEKSSGHTAGSESTHSSNQEQGTKADGSTGATASGDSASGAKADGDAAAGEPKPQSGIPWSLNRSDILIAGVCSGIARKAGCVAAVGAGGISYLMVRASRRRC